MRRLHSPDVEDIRTWTPPVQEDFGLLLQVFVAPTGSDGEESFDVVVCTHKWFAEQTARKPFTLGRHYLFVLGYDYAQLVDFIRRYVERPAAATWPELATIIGRLGRWEFEDYRASPGYRAGRRQSNPSD